MQNNLKGKTAWITGGKRIGQTIAENLAKEGVNIIASYRSSSTEAEEIALTAKKIGVKAISVKCDVSRKESVMEAVEEVKKEFKTVHILINLASVFNPVEFQNISESDWEKNVTAHILGSFWPSQKIAEMMPVGGHIINIADRTTLGKVYKGYLPYVVTKGAIGTMTKALAKELAGKGIFVNAIAPGPILRPEDISEKEWQDIRDSSPLKYEIKDEEAVLEFSRLILFLSTQTMASGYIYPLDQGQNL